VPIHDNLDVTHLLFKILAESGLMFGSNDAQIHNIFNGIPRGILGSEYNVQLWLFYFFGPYPAYAINKAIIHFVAFFGMFRLLTRHLIPPEKEALSIGVALTFALLPFYSPLGLSVAGLALTLDAFLMIRKGEGKKLDWLVITLMPLYSSLAHVYVFFLFLMGSLWAYDFILKKNANLKFLGSIALMAVVFLGVEYRYIYMLFYNADFASNRNEFEPTSLNTSVLFGLYDSVKRALNEFSFGLLYATGLQTFFIIPATIIGAFILVDRDIRDRRLWVLVALVILICGFNGIITSEIVWPLKERFPFLKIYRINRAYYLYPLLWMLIFALALKFILENSRKGKQVVCLFLFLQIAYSFFYNDEIQQRHGKPTYRGFYAQELFSEISSYIGKNKQDYRVISIGMHPSIAAYNGFYALDGYSSVYPLKHKHEFRKIIAKELDKNEKNKAYFDKFGGRCYVFADELAYADWLYTKSRNVVIKSLELNVEPFKKMGGEYILSAVEIKSPGKTSLEFLKVFDDPESAWKVYLYRPIVIMQSDGPVHETLPG